MERCALAGARLDPDPAAVACDHAAAEGETDAGAGRLVGGVKALEEREDPVLIPGRNAGAVVLHAKVPEALFLGGVDADPRRLGAAELEGVVEQILDCLLYTSPSPRDRTRSRMPSSA